MMKHWQAHIGIAAELRILIGSFVILVACVSSQAIAQSPRSDWLTESERAKFEQLRIAGSEALFNLDYERARKNFKEMAQSFPNYPAGPQFLADTLWVETLYQTRRLQSSLYGDDDTFYSTSDRSEEHTSELQSRPHLVCRLLLEKKKLAIMSHSGFYSSSARHDASPIMLATNSS